MLNFHTQTLPNTSSVKMKESDSKCAFMPKFITSFDKFTVDTITYKKLPIY